MKMKHLAAVLALIAVGASGALLISKMNLTKSEAVQPEAMQPEAVQPATVTPPVMNKIIPAPQMDNTHMAQNLSEKVTWIDQEIKAIEPQATNLNPNVLKLSLIAYEHAQQKGVTKKPLLTIIDYSKPSSDRRLWVVDLSNNKVLFNTWVAHGKNSGNATSTSFSNQPSSLKSSIGVFMTTDIYSGKHGNSLHVQGLESGVNDKAYSRSIVFHGADYVSGNIAKSTGRVGRSWGCMAVSQDVIQPLIHTIQNKALVVAYYPDQKWLKQSSFLT
jgi:hypothetical protein